MNEESSSEPPEAPSASDCCNSGCNPCVFDIYESQLLKWKNKQILNTRKDIRNDLLSQTKFKPFVLLKKVNITSDTYLLRFQPRLMLDQIAVQSGHLEQVIPGVLPYTPGLHFIMKSDDTFLKQTSESLFEVNEKVTVNACDVNKLSAEVVSSKPECEDNKNRFVEQSFITRAYTPISLSDKESNCCFNIVVKLYENGRMSDYIKRLNTDDVVYFRGPYGDFHYTSNRYKIIYMICIGTGIAPIYAIINHILNNDNDETNLKLLYGCRKVEDILLRNELQSFTSFWNFTLKYFISNHVTNTLSKKFGENFIFNRINEVDILEELSYRNTFNDCLLLICGTNEFNDMVSDICCRKGINSNNIHVFGN